MSDFEFPANAFMDPRGGNVRDVRRLARRFVDLALAHTSRAAERPPLPEAFVLPVDGDLIETPLSDDELVAQTAKLLESAANTESPDYMGHMGAFPTAVSAAGDFVASAVNNNMIGIELSPTFSLLEDALAKSFSRFFGLPDGAGGMVATGGSLSNLHALTVARNDRLGTLDRGVHALERAPVFFASEVAHASVKKSAMLLGLGSEGAVMVKTDRDSRMDTGDLREQIERVHAKGMQPFAVIATAGTTVTGNIDPVREIGQIARQHDLWFHVDAAWGGGLQFSPGLRGRLNGIADADSITFCPQKQMLVALSSSLTLFRDWGRMERGFRITFPYLQDDQAFVNRSEVGVQGSRPAEILKLWLSTKHVGTRAYAGLVEKWTALADDIAERVDARPDMELAARPESGIVCFRMRPEGMTEEDLDAWNAELHSRLLRDEGTYLSFTHYKGAGWLRAVFLNPYFDASTIDVLFERIGRVSESMVAEVARPA